MSYTAFIPSPIDDGLESNADHSAQDLGEHDPNGYDPHRAGAKLDAGKNRLGLVLGAFARALNEVGKVGTYGAEKYTPNGWLSVPDALDRYGDAQWRHRLAQEMGEELDPETGLLHAAHEAWNCLARLELILRDREASNED